MEAFLTKSIEIRALATFFRILGDPTRLRIIQLLLENDLTVAELVDQIGVPRSRVSNHLACLKHCRFVDVTPQGRSIRYRLVDEDLRSLLDTGKLIASSRVDHLASCDRIGPVWL